jgi:beta-glucosidase
LTETLTVSSVRGLQGPKDQVDILATAKHYVADGATEHGIEGGHCSISREEIMERLIPPYKRAVDEGIGAIMVSFNTVDSILMHANREFITDILKEGLGFQGIVLSDWKGFSRFGGIDIINAGVDMVMAVDGDLEVFQEDLKEAVIRGDVTEDRIDDAVSRILRQKFRLGLFENPFPDPDMAGELGTPAHRAVARKAVRESLVLLKNDNGTLPIRKDLEKIVVVGEHADNSGLQSGGWTITWQGLPQNYSGATTILEGITGIADSEIVYDKDATGENYDADVAIVVVGETPYAEFMGDIVEGNPYQLTLSDSHKAYIDTYAGKGPKLVLILVSGRPLVMTDQIEQSDAFIAAWLPGSEGDGIAEVLFGDYNFRGRLPHSWPRSVSDFDGLYGPNFWDKNSDPLFEFGFGLTY